MAIGANSQGYATIETTNGDEIHIRISNHNANVANYANRENNGENVSIVIKCRRSPNTFHAHPEVKLTEYVYTTEAVEADDNLLSQGVETLRDPDVIFIEPSQAKEGQTTERPFSSVFTKTFRRNGKDVKFYTSVTVQRDGLEISTSINMVSKKSKI